MTKSLPSVVLISEDAQRTSHLCDALRLNPAFDFEQRTATLSGLNGQATNLVSAHELVLFRTHSGNEADIAAVRNIKQTGEGNPVILALSDETMTLAQVQNLRNAGVDDVFAETVSADELQAKIARWLQLSNRHQTDAHDTVQKQGRIISVAQSRGGVGATTLAVNLADALLESTGWRKKQPKNKVALVDLNLQFGAVGGFLDVRSSEALYQLAMDGSEPDSTFLAQSVVTLASGLTVLTAPEQIAPLGALRKQQIRQILDVLRREFDFVVIDLPRAMVEWITPVLEQSDPMFLVTDSSVPAIQQAKRLIDFYSEVNPKMPVEVVVNFEKKPLFRPRHHVEASRVLERPLQHWLPYQPKIAKEALDRGVPLSGISARSALCKSIRKLATTTLETGPAQRPAQRLA